MKTHNISPERGQSMVLVALLLLAFVAILALAVDGGSAYAARRRAQNAADAGALAGATYMCRHRDATGGVSKAIELAVSNGAVNPPQVFASMDTWSVVVTATVQNDTFFAGMIGISQVSPSAVAEAECRPPVAMGVLPVAWACRATVEGGMILPGMDCTQKFGPCSDLSCIYILMDSVKVASNKKNGACDPNITDPTNPSYCYVQNDLICSPPNPPACSAVDPTKTDCDLDNDCVDELMTGGARSWLDLDGAGGGASELTNWILNGFPDPIPPHKWVPEEGGVAASIFKTVGDSSVGKNVILPVFDKVCPTNAFNVTTPETKDQCNAGTDDDTSIASTNMNFHIISFSQFHVSCVQTSKNKATDETGSVRSCPGHDKAVQNKSIDDNDKTIEGYFTKDQIYGYGGSGDLFDTGTFVVVLVR